MQLWRSELELVGIRGVHGNGEYWDPMGMGVRSAMGWEWELRRGSCHQQL